MYSTGWHPTISYPVIWGLQHPYLSTRIQWNVTGVLFFHVRTCEDKLHGSEWVRWLPLGPWFCGNPYACQVVEYVLGCVFFMVHVWQHAEFNKKHMVFEYGCSYGKKGEAWLGHDFVESGPWVVGYPKTSSFFQTQHKQHNWNLLATMAIACFGLFWGHCEDHSAGFFGRKPNSSAILVVHCLFPESWSPNTIRLAWPNRCVIG